MREPSQWNTIIAISHAVLLFVVIFTALFTALAVAIWAPVAIGRWLVVSAKNLSTRPAESHALAVAEDESHYDLAPGYVIIQRLARYTSNAWPTTRV